MVGLLAALANPPYTERFSNLGRVGSLRSKNPTTRMVPMVGLLAAFAKPPYTERFSNLGRVGSLRSKNPTIG